ncbi:MAG: (d)CMP kinase, partial [Terriglobia bacterium]
RAASVVAAIPEVRRLLVAQQQQLGAAGGVVMEGRDIGSIVFPKAELKIFLDASPEVRAQRRFQHQQELGISTSLEQTREEVSQRDLRDAERTASPLRRTPDAVYLDTTALSMEEVVEVIVRLARERQESVAGSRRRPKRA